MYDAGKSAKRYTVKLSVFRGSTTVAAGRLVELEANQHYIGLLHPIRLPESQKKTTDEDGFFFQSLKAASRSQHRFLYTCGRFAKSYFSTALFGCRGDNNPPHFSYKTPTNSNHVELRLDRVCHTLIVESNSCLKSGGYNTSIPIEGRMVWQIPAGETVSVSVLFSATLTKKRTAPPGPRDNNEFDRWVELDDLIVNDVWMRVISDVSTETDAHVC